ncbi:MAG TPA: DUF615 domain-containing protein [Clostridiales bacterium]|nr:DUF615 domain-containing protein [Clostridiales bacterium]
MSKNVLFTLLVILTALVIMCIIIGGAFYMVIHNNVYGLGEKYREQIQNITLLKWALPKPMDSDDPKYLNDKEIREKYSEIKIERDDLLKQLNEANLEINRLIIYKQAYEKSIQDKEKEKDYLAEEMKKLEKSKEEIQLLAVDGNKEGFKKYFETIDKEKAEKIYAQIMQDEKTEQDIKKFLQIYENMDEAAAARIFIEMGEKDIKLVVDILSGIKKEKASGILAEMKPEFASKVTREMSKVMLKTGEGR